ncbi:MAG: PPC domain-containing protein [Phototrophicaceae bacterium]
MRRITILLVGLLIFVSVPFIHAQDNPVELPALQDGDLVEASFEDDITTHLYAFNGSANDTVTINMTQLSNDLDPFLVLFNSDGVVLGYDDDSGSTSFAAELSNIRLDDDGVYFVMATSVLFVDAIETETSDELSYVLTISGQSTPNGIEDSDIVTLDVELLSIGDSVDGESTEDAPIALFYLNVSDGDAATISLEADFFTLLHVFAPNGDRVAADASFAQIEADQDGVYIIIATEAFFYESMDDGSFFEGGRFTLVIE